MLIEFSVGNYLSFKDTVTFSMVATDLGIHTRLDRDNVFQVNNELNLLKSAAVYGANASGKSNLVKAIGFMRWFVLNSSSRTQITDSIKVDRFRLSTDTEDKPSFFEIVFLLDKKIYRYGFELNQKKVVSEWLFYTPTSKEYKYFEREGQDFNVLKRFSEGKLLESKTRPNALFLSVAAQFNGKVSEQILLWFQRLGVLSGIGNNLDNIHTLELMDNLKYKQDIISLIKKLDLNINDLLPLKTKIPLDNFPKEVLENLVTIQGSKIGELENIERINIVTIHNKYDSQGMISSTEEFDFDENESEGTRKLFAFAGPILYTLKKGRVLLIDELDARLHPLITKTIVKLFNSQETNPNNAQLIFMIHDTNLLNNKLFRKDQIWFAEKDRYEATDLYSLVEYELPNDASFEYDYIKGRYGAIPFIGDIKSLIAEHNAGIEEKQKK
ncbi:MAG: ATP-binding protein [Cyanobacteria bacterium P01_A01_bin.83]